MSFSRTARHGAQGKKENTNERDARRLHYAAQLWFRNTPIMFCDPAAAFNLSNGKVLAWW